MTTTLEAALQYAARDIAVYPVDGKIPFKGTHGDKEATTDCRQIIEWWERWPKANVAILCADRLTVLDVDTHGANGYEALRHLLAENGQKALPLTPASHTGGGGMHVLFEYNPDVKIGGFAPGLEFIGHFVAPPSLHPSGQRYQWNQTLDLDTPLAPLPVWLTEAARKGPSAPSQGLDGAELSIPVGTRHNLLLKLGCRARYDGASEAAVRQILVAWNEFHCEQPYPLREIAALARDICNRYQPGGKPEITESEYDRRLLASL